MAAAIVLLIAALLWGWARLFPLQASRLSTLVELRWNGVRSIEAAGLAGYSRDFCAPGAKAEYRKCACIALIHGLGDDALTWKRILLTPREEWAHPVRLYAFDLPGSGASLPPVFERDYQVRRMAKRMIEVLDSLPGCQRWLVVGNSLGGWVAAWLAMDGFPRVNKLVLVSPGGLKVRPSTDLLTEPTVESLKEFQRRAYHRPREIPESVWKKIAERAREGNSRKVVAAQVPEDFLDTYLPSLRVPTFVFWGSSDRIIPIEQGRYFTSLIRGAQLHEAPECGHLPQKECPKALLKTINAMLVFGAM